MNEIYIEQIVTYSIRQYHDRLMIESPGGFPVGISLENILDRQLPRNRRIAEILALCGLVERSGQGMNLIYELSIKEAKQLPDFSGTDDYFVQITLNGMVLDKKMLSVINQIICFGTQPLFCCWKSRNTYTHSWLGSKYE